MLSYGRMKSRWLLVGQTVGVFFLSSFYFTFMQPWGGFVDPDAFYHAKMAMLMSEHGSLHRFPWLDLTIVDRLFADQHWLFHVLLIPFVRSFGMMHGTQIAAVVFAALFMAVFFFVLRALQIPKPMGWTFLLMITPFELIRLSFGKASPLALIWFVFGLLAISATHLSRRMRVSLAFVVGCGFALSHGGWVVLLMTQGLYLIGEALHERVLVERSWSEIVTRSSWTVVVATLCGIALGMILHPNFPTTISFLWVQVWKIAALTPFDQVRLGNEWLPADPSDLIQKTAPLLFSVVGVFYGLLFSRRVSRDLERMRPAIAWGVPVAALVALCFKSLRFAEYACPVVILWMASLATFVDPARFRRALPSPTRIRTWIFAGAIVAAVLRQQIIIRSALQTHATPFDAFVSVMHDLRLYAHPNERIMHTSWDMFPQLFATDDGFRYVSGLDPTFLLENDPTRARLYQRLMMNALATSTFEVITKDFDSHFVIVDPMRQYDLDQTFMRDPRFVLHTSTTHAKLYALVP